MTNRRPKDDALVMNWVQVSRVTVFFLNQNSQGNKICNQNHLDNTSVNIIQINIHNTQSLIFNLQVHTKESLDSYVTRALHFNDYV